MKMEHRIGCPTAGTITAILVEVGEQVDTGTLLATVDDHQHDPDPDSDPDPDHHHADTHGDDVVDVDV
jgi:pyruvate/2-oxoglutarate dehydrogenase complex dihydrolipoamide acyltransferase (E2) component